MAGWMCGILGSYHKDGKRFYWRQQPLLCLSSRCQFSSFRKRCVLISQVWWLISGGDQMFISEKFTGSPGKNCVCQRKVEEWASEIWRLLIKPFWQNRRGKWSLLLIVCWLSFSRANTFLIQVFWKPNWDKGHLLLGEVCFLEGVGTEIRTVDFRLN